MWQVTGLAERSCIRIRRLWARTSRTRAPPGLVRCARMWKDGP